jgi:3-hydroxybutyryl-CoA dehydrogenase
MERPVTVIGAGVMGAGIAQVLASAGFRVAVQDPDPAARAAVPERVAAAVRHVGGELGATLERITVHEDAAAAVACAGLVIEAGPERLAIKRDIFAAVSAVAPADAVLASNTSAIPIGAITADVPGPERIMGMHFWNPPHLVPLVEVIETARTSPELATRMRELLERAGLKPVRVGADVPGFVGNRLQHALKREAIALVAEGICDAETVDTVVRYGFGLRLAAMGPLEQSDLSGLQLTLDIHRTLMPALDTTPVAHPYLEALVARGETGAAVGRGFRPWTPEQVARARARVTTSLIDQARRRRDHQEED